ncbi:alpha/beta fold hydrolase [Paraliobacillus sp. X-1268]|uniref:alpha/beta fold hydrolase n=1 Tax=Paraliobacillus TaxID=200903 RepID=UPI003512DF28
MDALLMCVVEILQLDNFILLGHSTGGAIAIRYMARYEDHRVSNLVLLAAAAPTGFSPETANNLIKEALNDRPKMMHGITNTFFFQYISRQFSDWFQQIGLEAASWSTAAIIVTLRNENLDEIFKK